MKEKDAWFTPKQDGYKMICCDCGLAHNLDFRICCGRVQIRVSRNNQETERIRNKRHMILLLGDRRAS